MNRVINFHKAFAATVAVSVVIILFGIFGVFTKGFTNGVDFQAGMQIRIQFGNPALTINYTGPGLLNLTAKKDSYEFIVRNTGSKDNKQFVYTFAKADGTAKSINDLVAEMTTNAATRIDGLNVSLRTNGAIPATDLLTYTGSNVSIGEATHTLSFKVTKANKALATQNGAAYLKDVSVKNINDALLTLNDGSVTVQSLGDEADQEYMIRVQVRDNKDTAVITTTVVQPLAAIASAVASVAASAEASAVASAPEISGVATPVVTNSLEKRVQQKLIDTFGADTFIIRESISIDPRFSEDLANSAMWMTILTFFVILVYCSIRFRLEYAVGAVLSVVHDALVLVCFIVWFQIEFNTTIIAAILTIVGYSINDTIVIYDRIREKVKQLPDANFRDQVDRGVTETLGRTVITALTVLLAAFAMYMFTTGSLKDFSLCIMVGVTTGTYSSVFIASSFVYAWKNVSKKRSDAKKALQAPAWANKAAAKKD